jgi:hypothetical protein
LSGNFDGTGVVVIDLESYLAAPGDGFLGIVGSGSFSSITFGTRLAADEAFAVDDLAFTLRIPEPGSLALLGLGIALAGFLRAARG